MLESDQVINVHNYDEQFYFYYVAILIYLATPVLNYNIPTCVATFVIIIAV